MMDSVGQSWKEEGFSDRGIGISERISYMWYIALALLTHSLSGAFLDKS
jgi:hypothetical protein